MAEFHLTVPLQEDEIKKLRIGDLVFFSGPAWTCRSRLHRYVFDEGHPLPFSTRERNLLIHVGPVVLKEKGKWRLLSFTPTSSIRFEKWGPKSIHEWRLKAIIGKTTMGKSSMETMKEETCLHATPIGIIPNLYQDQIQIQDVYWLEELGSIEAAWILKLKDLGPEKGIPEIGDSGRFRVHEIVLKRSSPQSAIGTAPISSPGSSFFTAHPILSRSKT
jgi:tartrate dehydratase beta subunit/fumarate hydratase class I family protein